MTNSNDDEILYAYLAGIMDGEGCFNIGKQYPNKNRKRIHYNLNIVIDMTDKEAIELFQRTFGGKICKGGYKNDKWKPYYRITICKIESIYKILNSILPYLTIKRKQALIILEALKLRQQKNYQKNDAMLNMLENMYLNMKQLNFRGNVVTITTES